MKRLLAAILCAITALFAYGCESKVMTDKKKDENYVNVYFLGYVNLDKLESDRTALNKASKEHDADLNGIEFSNLLYDGAEYNDPSMAQVYSVQLFAGDNDILLQNATLTQSVMDVDFCAPLEKLKGFNEFVQANPNIKILWQPSGIEASEIDRYDYDALAALEKHAYAIDISNMTGLQSKGGYENGQKYAAISANSKNPDTSLYVLLKMFELYAPDFVMPTIKK